MFSLIQPETEHLGDYSYSLIGMPLLVSLFNKRAARKFCIGWVKEYGCRFHSLNRGTKPYYHFYQTKKTLYYNKRLISTAYNTRYHVLSAFLVFPLYRNGTYLVN